MIFKAPGKLPENIVGVKYLAPGDAGYSTIVPFSAIGGDDQTNIFPNGIIVTGGIETDDINVTNEATVENLGVAGNIQLAETSQILHGSWRTRVDGDRQYREYWNGTTWVEGDIVSP